MIYFFLLLDSCCSSLSDPDHSARFSIYRAFPWIGIYLYAQHVNGWKKQSLMILAFICMVVVFYCLYLSSIFIWSTLLFYKSIPRGLDENFYGFVAFLEFLTLLFIRTRSTLKWFPRFSFIMVLSFLYYVQFNAYGFPTTALFVLMTVVSAIFFYHIIIFEVPALSWNPVHHYTPSVDSPRTLFFRAFSLSWFHDLPQLWTMFYPLFGRSRFTQAQLAMVDRNTVLLHQTLDQAFQRGQNIGQEGNQEQNENELPNVNQPAVNNSSESLANPINTNAASTGGNNYNIFFFIINNP